MGKRPIHWVRILSLLALFVASFGFAEVIHRDTLGDGVAEDAGEVAGGGREFITPTTGVIPQGVRNAKIPTAKLLKGNGSTASVNKRSKPYNSPFRQNLNLKGPTNMNGAIAMTGPSKYQAQDEFAKLLLNSITSRKDGGGPEMAGQKTVTIDAKVNTDGTYNVMKAYAALPGAQKGDNKPADLPKFPTPPVANSTANVAAEASKASPTSGGGGGGEMGGGAAGGAAAKGEAAPKQEDKAAAAAERAAARAEAAERRQNRNPDAEQRRLQEAFRRGVETGVQGERLATNFNTALQQVSSGQLPSAATLNALRVNGQIPRELGDRLLRGVSEGFLRLSLAERQQFFNFFPREQINTVLGENVSLVDRPDPPAP